MISTYPKSRFFSVPRPSQSETIPSILEIAGRVKAIRGSWTQDERRRRAHLGRERLDRLAALLGVGPLAGNN